MGKQIRKIKIISFIIIFIELILIGLFSVFYFLDLFKLKTLIKVEYVILGSLALVFLNCLFVWISSLRISSLRQKTDLRAAEVIGNDVQEAYNFAMIALAVTDDNDIVLWTNELFNSRHIDIIDMNILTWKPELAQLKQATSTEETTKIIINERNYEVKYLPDASLWIFKDITDYEYIYKYSKDEAPVVGILAIDNYDDVVRGEEDSNDVVTKVKSEIFNYAKEHGVLLRRFKDENYSMLCNYKSFLEMKNDHFSIIDKVRQASSSEEIPLTLSIGIAHDFPDVIKLNELASSALDIAMSRGGDQVVVTTYGAEMEFFGGKTEAQEKRNRVKIRVLADSLIGLIKNSSNVLVMGHKEMDMDALGACLGIKAICNRLSKPCFIVVDYKSTESKTRAAITTSFSKEELEKMIISPKDALNKIGPDTLLTVCDVHIPNMVMCPELLDKASKIVVIDHHRRAEDYIDSPVFNHIDPAASSASELVTEFIRFSSINPRIELPSTYATIMLSGIFLDSAYFKSKNTGIRTFEAATILKEFGADNSLADDLLKDDYEEYTEVNQIIKDLRTPSYGVVYAVANPERYYDRATIAKAANTCLTMKGIHAVFIIGKTEPKEIRISARSDGMINVQLLAEKMGGGGHFTSAAVVFEKSDINAVEELLLNTINTYLSEAKADTRNKNIMEE